ANAGGNFARPAAGACALSLLGRQACCGGLNTSWRRDPNPALGIVLVNYEGLEDTLRCLESLCRQQTPPARLIVVDNASRHDPSAVAVRYPQCVLIRRAANGGWAGGNNTGIRYALRTGCRLVALLNNDTVVAPSFVERLAAAAEGNPEFGVFGPLIYALDRPDELMTAGCRFNWPESPGFFQH